MLQKTFLHPKVRKIWWNTQNRAGTFQQRVENGAGNDGPARTTARTQHAEKKRPPASAGRQTGRERLYAGHVRPGPPTGTGDRKEGTGKRARPGACGNPPGNRTSPGGGREPRTEEAPHKKKPRTEKNPARKEPRTEEAPLKKKPRPRECFARKKIPGGRDRTGDHFAQFAQGKIPHGSGKYQR